MSDDEEDIWEEELDEEDLEDLDSGRETVQEALFWNTASSAVLLAGTNKVLVVEGPDAGQVSEVNQVANMEEEIAPALIGRDEALDGTRPIFLAHRGGQHHRHLSHVLTRLHQGHGNDIAVGAILKIHGQSADASREFFQQCATAAVRIADPACYMLDEDILRLKKDPISNLATNRAPYLKGPDHAGFVEDVLGAQRDLRANLLLTPGRALDADSPKNSLNALFQEGENALALLERGERLALNLTLPARWLISPSLREQLFNELLDRDEHQIWYVRSQWRAQRSYAQPSDIELLNGYKRLCELALDEDRRLLLPQTGLTGWLMLAFGAKGFGAGSSGTDQAFTEPSFGRKPGAIRKQRYFERQLLHAVERSVHDVLETATDYKSCDCPYCPTLWNSPSWSHEFAGLHLLYRTGQLVAEVEEDTKPGGRHSAVRRIVRDALKYVKNKELTDINAPQHLATWGQLL
ncbi:hypothetical protein [Sphaerisporangium fuscum]|uniref:hypothetical protein n=1 Tax=Sphaerisporangium fuscum TaxID=2835868 RepID=UPI001BDC42D8|nr:hypothetical protein [Sphaerisporangium fuscum]